MDGSFVAAADENAPLGQDSGTISPASVKSTGPALLRLKILNRLYSHYLLQVVWLGNHCLAEEKL
jgi:hypothetical protein